jgi:hypothetical protein
MAKRKTTKAAGKAVTANRGPKGSAILASVRENMSGLHKAGVLGAAGKRDLFAEISDGFAALSRARAKR